MKTSTKKTSQRIVQSSTQESNVTSWHNFVSLKLEKTGQSELEGLTRHLYSQVNSSSDSRLLRQYPPIYLQPHVFSDPDKSSFDISFDSVRKYLHLNVERTKELVISYAQMLSQERAEYEEKVSRIKKVVKRFGKYAGIALTSALVLLGTIGGQERGLPPIYVRKVGKSAGICLGIYTVIESGAELNGASMSLFSNNKGTVNGSLISIINGSNAGKVNGLELTAASFSNDAFYDSNNPISIPSSTINGVQIGVLGAGAKYLNGVQIGAFNVNADYAKGLQISPVHTLAEHAKGIVQIGIFNRATASKGVKHNSIIANYTE